MGQCIETQFSTSISIRNFGEQLRELEHTAWSEAESLPVPRNISIGI